LDADSTGRNSGARSGEGSFGSISVIIP
jgi:hypothetical protein